MTLRSKVFTNRKKKKKKSEDWSVRQIVLLALNQLALALNTCPEQYMGMQF